MWIVQLALRRTYTFVVLGILILVVGVVAVRRMATDNFPEIDIPVITVVWGYQGMSADDIEKRILLINERSLTATVNDIEHIESQAINGVGVIRIFFYPRGKIEAAVAQVSATCQTVLSSMPPGITPPYIVRYSATSVPIVQIAVSSDTLPEQTLFDQAANKIIQRLGTIQGARVPQPFGGKPRQVMVDIDPALLAGLHLSAADISSAINAQNLILPAGTAKIGRTEYNVRLHSSFDTAEAFNNIPIKTVAGKTIYLRDVAHVRDGFAVQTNVVRRDGKRAILMTILKGEGASTLDIVQRIRAALPGIQDGLVDENKPDVKLDVKLDLLFDQSAFVRDAVDGVLEEGAIAAGLTALLILLFLGSWRSTLVVVTSIPLSVFCSIIVLWLLGGSLNVMTLGGLALAVGILVDDATVEIENIHRNLAQGKPLRQAILDGAQQIAVPAFVSTLAICIVFVPVFFLTGPVAYLFVPLSLAVVFAMLASYLLSRTLVPTMVLYLLRGEKHESGVRSQESGVRSRESGACLADSRPPTPDSCDGWHGAFNRAFERLRQAYTGLLELALRRRWLTVSLLLGFALASLALFPLAGRDFFPTVDAGQIRLHVRAPAGTRVEETERIFGRIEDSLRKLIPDTERKMILDNIGISPSYSTTAFIDNDIVSEADGEILIALKPGHKPTADYLRQMRRELPEQFPGCTFYFMPADITGQVLAFGKSAPINVQVVGGAKREESLKLARHLRKLIAEIPGAVDVHLRQIPAAPELRLEVDRELASGMNLTEQEAARSLLITLSSSNQTAPNFWINPKNNVSYRVAIQTPQRQISSADRMLRIPVTSGDGTSPQLLANLADLTRGTSPALISHYNIQPVYEICASVQDRDLGAVASEIRQKVAEAELTKPKGTSLQIVGQVENMDDAFKNLGWGMVFAVLLVYLLMVVNFQSWLDPFIILTALPGALAGILWALFVTGTTISVPALMGSIMTVGVATANSILMVTFANQRRRDGLDALAAAREAGATRLRPVLMTALAMVVGMLPMSLGLGDGGEQNAPLGRAVIGGLLLATVYTLFLVPTLYTLLGGRSVQAETEDTLTHEAQS
jgi:multidrug efflux pump subunit AcrB